MNGIPDSGLNTTQRGVRTQYDKLIEDFVKKEKEEKKATGTDGDYDELDQLLNDTYERASDAAADLAMQSLFTLLVLFDSIGKYVGLLVTLKRRNLFYKVSSRTYAFYCL